MDYFSIFKMSVSALAIALLTQPPEQVLRDKGLLKKASYFVVEDEIEFSKHIKEVKQVQVALDKALKRRGGVKQNVSEDRERRAAMVAERQRLSNQLSSISEVHNTVEYNRLVGRINSLTDSIRMIDERLSGDAYEEIDRDIAELRSQYIEAVSKVRQLHDSAVSQYDAHKQDSEIKAALESLNAERKRPLKLGPRKNFNSNVRKLKNLESRIDNSSIELRADNGVLWVDVLLNNAKSVEMVLDTGAGIILLPGKVAAAIGIRPEDLEETVRMQVADGRIVEGKRGMLKSVRIGTMEVENVECTILPSEFKDVDPLLGGSFLKNFTYEIDPASQRLRLTKIVTKN